MGIGRPGGDNVSDKSWARFRLVFFENRKGEQAEAELGTSSKAIGKLLIVSESAKLVQPQYTRVMISYLIAGTALLLGECLFYGNTVVHVRLGQDLYKGVQVV